MLVWPLADQSVHGVLARAVELRPELSITFTDDRAYTVVELHDSARRIAAAILASGVSPGEHVGVMVTNRVQMLTGFFGVLIAGCVAVPVNTAQRGAVLEHMLTLCEIKLLLLDGDLVPEVGAVLANAPMLSIVATSSPVAPGWRLPDSVTHVEMRKWEDYPELAEPVTPRRDELAMMMLTSGTTGPSKAIMWTHSSALIMAEQSATNLGFSSDDVVFTCLPLVHGNALFCSTVPAIMRLADIVIGPRFSASNFWQQVTQVGATKLSLLGTMHGILFGQPPGPFDRAHRVDRAVVAPAPLGYYTEFEERFGLTITQFYGLTDMNQVIAVPRDEALVARTKPGSCGKGLPAWDLMIADEHDEPVARGEVGELLIRPRIPFTGQLGYYHMPEATIRAWRNMWFHTGDHFRMDEDGWYYFVDRAKDALRRAGENISSFEVESVLKRFPGIVEAAVYAVPSAKGEDEVMVALEVDETWAEDHKALLTFCSQELAYFAIPRYFRVMDALPRTDSQKVQKDVLRQQGVTHDTWDRGPSGRKELARQVKSGAITPASTKEMA